MEGQAELINPAKQSGPSVTRHSLCWMAGFQSKNRRKKILEIEKALTFPLMVGLQYADGGFLQTLA